MQDIKSRLVVVSSTAHLHGDNIDLQVPILQVTTPNINQSESQVYVQDLHYKHGRRYFFIGPYGQSKLANILFAKEFARRFTFCRCATSISTWACEEPY